MKRTKVFGALGLVVGFCCLAYASPGGASQPTGQSAPAFSIVLTGPASPVPVNGPIIVAVTIINITDKPLWWDPRYVDFRYLLERDGQKIERTFPNRRGPGKGRRNDPSANLKDETVVVSYPPGKMFKFTLDLKRLYKITEPGTYTFQINVSDSVPGTLVKSNPVTITVTEPSRALQPQGAAAPRPTARTSYTPAIDTLDDTVTAGSQIRLQIEVTNTSNDQFVYDPGITKLVFDVRNAQGGSAPLMPAGESLRKMYGSVGHGQLITVPQGKTMSAGAAQLDKIYDLSKPGKYTVQVSRFDDTTKVWVKSNTITLTVTP